MDAPALVLRGFCVILDEQLSVSVIIAVNCIVSIGRDFSHSSSYVLLKTCAEVA